MMHHHPDAMEGVEVHHVQAHNPPPNHQPQNMNMNMNMMGIEPVRSSLPLEPSSRKVLFSCFLFLFNCSRFFF